MQVQRDWTKEPAKFGRSCRLRIKRFQMARTTPQPDHDYCGSRSTRRRLCRGLKPKHISHAQCRKSGQPGINVPPTLQLKVEFINRFATKPVASGRSFY